ncbi:THAP domain-containing protein 4-like isoform X2 [Belonocnema kinseyi]|uniref:THAP domain-containing protein 4-like isoform X2 n=1 Tax=Belonocnema kinseyi TaxID=2817044 RepID=UPI00143D1B03|nr:THAP domain-containing protein 4-like isoform X2 [Belonocnema kinseyi]
MGKCAFCGKSKKQTATLHRFPREETLYQQWMKLIGREGWMPTRSLLCSDHFRAEDFSWYNDSRTKKRLKPGILPTIFPKIKSKPSAELLVMNNFTDDYSGVSCNRNCRTDYQT